MQGIAMNEHESSSFSTPAYARLRDQIRSDVVSGVWQLGQHLTLATLTAHYGVSANPVREALHQLQGEGIVDMRLNRGAIIRKVNARYIGNIYDIRGAIEAMLAAEAARVADKPYIAGVTRDVEAFEAAAASGSALEIVGANRRLHRTVYAICDNPLARDILEGRSTLVDALRRSIGYSPQRLTAVMKQHRGLLEALKARDPDRAGRVSQVHTLSARDDLLQALAERGTPEIAQA